MVEIGDIVEEKVCTAIYGYVPAMYLCIQVVGIGTYVRVKCVAPRVTSGVTWSGIIPLDYLTMDTS